MPHSFCWKSLIWRIERVGNSFLNGVNSGLKNVISEVPQGSHIDPLLSVIYSNGISGSFFNTRFALFADDLKVNEDCFRMILNVLLRFLQLDIWGLLQGSLNIKFSVIIEIFWDILPFWTMKSLKHFIMLEIVEFFLYSKFSFFDHMEHIVTKSFKILGFRLRITKSYKNVNTLKIL